MQDDGSAAARRFHERVRNPLLTDIAIDWAGLPVADVYPKRIPDLFSVKPLILTGRYTGAARGVIRLRGKMAGQNFVKEIPIELPESQTEHDVLATLWARTRIDDLMSQDYAGMQNGSAKPDVQEAITQLGLEYRLMTQFTSFVAVEEMTVTDGGQPRRIDVPVEMPEGVSREGVFGEEGGELYGQRSTSNPFEKLDLQARLSRPPKVSYKTIASGKSGSRVGRGVSYGSGAGSGGYGPGGGGNAGGGIARLGGGNAPPLPPAPTARPAPEIPNYPKRITVLWRRLARQRNQESSAWLPATSQSREGKWRGSSPDHDQREWRGNHAQVISGHPMLRDAALQAAKQWRFKPARFPASQ